MFFNGKTRLRLWIALTGLLILMITVQLWRGVQLETNILALLPETESKPAVEAAVARVNQYLSANLVMLVEGSGIEQTELAAALVYEHLEKNPLFSKVIGPIQENRERAFFDLYSDYRYQLLSQSMRTRLQGPKGGQVVTQRAEKELYSPLSSMYSDLLESDPLLLTAAFLQALPRPAAGLSVRNGWLSGQQQGRHYILLNARLKETAFGNDQSGELEELFTQIEKNLFDHHPDVSFHATGMARYAAAGRQSAEREVTLIGTGSILGVFLLFWLVFRSPYPILLGLLPIAAGLLAAATFCFAAFDRVHLVTMIFGASLIGVCIDYTFHFFGTYLGGTSKTTPELALRAVLAAITMGALTSILGYSGMLLAPFPGLKQMAAFSCVGLIAAWLTVVCVFPNCGPWLGRASFRGTGLAARYAALWQRPNLLKVLLIGATLLALLITLGLARLRSNDDIRSLQTPPAALKAQEDIIRQRSGGLDNSRFFVVSGDSAEQVLIREESLNQQLEQLKQAGSLDFFHSVSQFLPSTARQTENWELLRQALVTQGNWLERYTQKVGFEAQVFHTATQALTKKPDPLTPAQWLDHPCSELFRYLWLAPETGNLNASLVTIGGVADLTALRALATDGVYFIDIVDDYSALLARYRVRATWLTGLTYFLILVVLALRYGLARGLLVITPPVLAALVALASFGLLGLPINLFNILALLLVLGIGVDYTIFFAEAPGVPAHTLWAITLSATTTLLSFGLLALSETAFLSQFGLTITLGISTALLLSPLPSLVKSQNPQGRTNVI